MEKQTFFKHGISENGNLQVYLITRYIKDGKTKAENTSLAMTPSDSADMSGWDDRSKEIVKAITAKDVLADFEAEKQEVVGLGLEEVITYDRMPDELSRIAVRWITRIFDNGEEVSKTYHRSWIMPGDDYSNADAMSKALAKHFHTPECIAEYLSKISASGGL